MKLGGFLAAAMLTAALSVSACAFAEGDAESVAEDDFAACSSGTCAVLPPELEYRKLTPSFSWIPSASKRFFVVYERSDKNPLEFVAYGVDVTNQKISWRIRAARTDYGSFSKSFGAAAANKSSSLFDFGSGSAGGPGIKVGPKGPGGDDWKAWWVRNTATELSNKIDTAFEW